MASHLLIGLGLDDGAHRAHADGRSQTVHHINQQIRQQLVDHAKTNDGDAHQSDAEGDHAHVVADDDDAESPIILWEQRVEGMFHHGLTADHTDESAITIHHRQFLELLLGEDSGHLSDMLVQKRLILLC